MQGRRCAARRAVRRDSYRAGAVSAPLHYHFELGGMPETRVVAMYDIVNAVLCLVALLAFTA